MVDMLERAKILFDRFIFSDKLPLDKRVYNLVGGFGLLASLAAVSTRFLEHSPPLSIALTAAIPLLLLIFLFCGNFYRAYRLGMLVTLILCCNLLFPLVFFTSGGAGSGMDGYFVLSLVLTVVLIHGRACAVLLGLNSAVIVACYALDYFFPALTLPASARMQHLDNLHGYLIAGLFIGALIKFQAMIHIEEKQKAEAASEAKAAFLASVSHAIRTPLNAIMGLSELQLRRNLQRETLDNLEKIYGSGLTLLNIINDILDISRIESGKFQLVPADYEVADTINDTISLNMVRIGSKDIEFAVEIDDNIPAVLRGDELRVKQVLNNILSNAFKYTEAGEVRLKIECERDRRLAWMSVIVSDTGPGIRQEDMGLLFADFRRLHMRGETRQEGTGLGLSIARNLTEMMGGAIMVESEYGRGSSFTIVFPQEIVDPAPLGPEAARSLAARSFSSRRRAELLFEYEQMPYARVLVVDDVEINLMVAESLLQPYGLGVDCVSGGLEAVRRIREQAVTYDAVFMDHMMPDMDGLEAVRIIREEIGTAYAAAVPIIALTANALVGNEEMFLENGFQAFLPKPIDGLRLDAVLKTWVRKPQATGGGA